MLCTDLNYLEETAGGPDLTVAMLPKSGKIVLLQVCVISIEKAWYKSIVMVTIVILVQEYLAFNLHFHCWSGFLPCFQMDSRLHMDNLDKVLKSAMQGCARVHTVLDSSIKNHLEESIPTFALFS